MREYPVNVLPRPTLVLAQGSYEYILDKMLFLRVLRSFSTVVILTYNFQARVNMTRVAWVAPLTKSVFATMVSDAGFTVEIVGQEGTNVIYKMMPTTR
mmetsp:Transcript_72726/g.236174  ORF Transcript_72726/g.236174 Transcript_72726/m.236174 type:complete len:98 (-) Transcript_72726:5-298(-)